MNKRGVVLIICYMAIAALTILGAAFITRSVSERSVTSKYFDSTQAFWLAEAGVNKAIVQLRNNYTDLSSISSTPLIGAGEYSAAIASSGNNRIVTASGFVPDAGSTNKVQRVLEVTIRKNIPSGFYDHAIYAAGDLVRKGNVNGTVIYADTATGSYKNPQPTSETHDASISPLALLDFDQLRILSKAQDNYHDASHLDGPFPASFWYTPPDPGNGILGVPNFVFLEGSFTLKGNDRVGGFFVVGGGGDVVYDATLAGTVNVDGCIYTRGNFTVKGGGGAAINVNNIWAGGTTTLGGSSVITYNQQYMDAIKALGINAGVQIVSWRETQNPF